MKEHSCSGECLGVSDVYAVVGTVVHDIRHLLEHRRNDIRSSQPLTRLDLA